LSHLLDTSFVIDVLRGLPAARERFARLFEEGGPIYVDEIVACEAAAGSHLHPDPALTGLLRPLEFIQPGPESALDAGRWRAEARRRGRTLSLPDALIAAAAVAMDATVITRNVRDFALTPAVVESY
jgi:predicted nucleic acid-binding protein